MRALGPARFALSVAIAALTACSIWAALDDPYKHDPPPPLPASVPEASVEAAAPDAGSRNAGQRVATPRFTPVAIAAQGDTVFAMDDNAAIHVAYDAGTSFTTFWSGSAGNTFTPQTNGIAASDDGVFWTLGAGLDAGAGVGTCALDGGGCSFLAVGAPRAVAAGGGVVAWLDNTGVRACTTPLRGCVPASIGGSRGAVSVAVGLGGTVAWTDGGTAIGFWNGDAGSSVALKRAASLLETDDVSGNLYWLGVYAVGYMAFDGGSSKLVELGAGLLGPPTQLFAAHGVVYWALGSAADIFYCKVDPSSSCPTVARLVATQSSANDGIIADSRSVLAVVDQNPTTVLFRWALPSVTGP